MQNTGVVFIDEEFVKNIPPDFKGYLLETIDRDTVGRSNANPRWNICTSADETVAITSSEILRKKTA